MLEVVTLRVSGNKFISSRARAERIRGILGGVMKYTIGKIPRLSTLLDGNTMLG